MRERVPHLVWLAIMPRRTRLAPLDAAQESRDIAEHEVGRCFGVPSLRDQLAFWSEEYRRTEYEFQRLMALQSPSESQEGCP